MIRHIRLRYQWLSHQHIFSERRVREPVSPGMRDPLLEGNCFKHAAECTGAQGIQCLLCGEHRLIMVCVKIPSNNEPIYAGIFAPMKSRTCVIS